MTRLSLCLLGGFEVHLDDIQITGFESAKVRALLAYLAAEAGRSHLTGGRRWLRCCGRIGRSNLP
jgi:hypothetical protein